jgi:hypothetical protein
VSVRDVTVAAGEFVSLDGYPRPTSFVNLNTLKMVHSLQSRSVRPDTGPIVVSSDGFEMDFHIERLLGTEKDLLHINVSNMRTGRLLRHWEISCPRNLKIDSAYVKGKTMVIHACAFPLATTKELQFWFFSPSEHERKKTILVCTGVLS